MKKVYKGANRRQFLRLDFKTPLQFKVCKKKTISMLLKGYTSDISEAGLLCNMKEKVSSGDLVWLCFDRATLIICGDLEKRALIYQSGIIGKVVRVVRKARESFDVGVRFLTREEKNLTHIYPKIHFAEELAESRDEEN
ncbi:MAG: PilZ domain-containing protein [Candidatus Omnitrophota bacterium]